MRKIFLALFAGLFTFLICPRKANAPHVQELEGHYPGTSIPVRPGDLLFSPLGKKESRYVGHVGMVSQDLKVVHSIPSGLIKDTVDGYFNKFTGLTLYSAKEDVLSQKAATHLEKLFHTYPKAAYRIWTPLSMKDHEQYCTKIVWQSFYYGAGINLGAFNKAMRAIPPQLLRDKKHLDLIKKFQ